MSASPPASRSFSLAALLILSVAGLMLALSLQSASASGVCQLGGCEKVWASTYSHIGHWPLASFGAAFYAAMIVLWAASLAFASESIRRTILMVATILSALALAISLFLVGLQILVIHALCPLCLTSAGICLAIAALTFHLFRHPNWRPQPLAAIAALLLLGAIGLHLLPPPQPIVARLGHEVITRAEMEHQLGPAGRRAQWAIYRAEKDWLDQKLTDMLVQREAAARHMSPGDLVQRELNDPVDQQTETFMKKNAGRFKPEDAPIVRAQLQARFKADRADAFVAELMKKYGAVEYLPAPMLDEKDLDALPGPHRGANARTAPIRLVIFSDFGCEYCAHTSQVISAAMKKYPGRLSLTFHYLPLDIHPRGKEAAIAADCANEQHKFWPFHDALMAHQGQLGGVDFVQTAAELGLDQKKFRECLNSDTAEHIINESKHQADLLGIDATPAVFLNGRRIGGDLNATTLQEWLDHLLPDLAHHSR